MRKRSSSVWLGAGFQLILIGSEQTLFSCALKESNPGNISDGWVAFHERVDGLFITNETLYRFRSSEGISLALLVAQVPHCLPPQPGPILSSESVSFGNASITIAARRYPDASGTFSKTGRETIQFASAPAHSTESERTDVLLVARQYPRIAERY